MKQILKTKAGTILLAVLGGLAVAALAQELGGDWWEVRGAIRDIAAGRDVAKARTTLEKLNDRGYVLKKLEEAVADESLSVRAKYELLMTLNAFSQPRALRRALDSSSVTAQRAACWQLYGDPEAKTRCGEIALAWLKDEKAPDRSIAAMVSNQLKLEEAQPVLLAIVQKNPATHDDLRLFQQALFALKDPKPQELIERLLTMAGDPALDAEARGVALEVLQRTKDGPRDRILALATQILTDAGTDRVLRIKAAAALREFPEDRAWQALEEVLLSEKEKDGVLQRTCLYSLGQMTPGDPGVADRYLDRLTQLLLDRRVYHNPYFALRVDVATALCALNVREPIAIDIMCDYLVDDDKDDRKEHLVRQQGWLTLWTLTGVKIDFPAGATGGKTTEELFGLPPPPYPDRKAAREFYFSRFRPGITADQNTAIAKTVQDLAWMQKSRQVYQGQKSAIVQGWRDQAAKAEEARKLAEERKREAKGQIPEPKKEEGAEPPQKPN